MVFGIYSIFQRNTYNIDSNDEAFNIQITALDKASESLANLDEFIAGQKKSLIDTNKVLEELKKEKDELQPILESDKKAINSIFSVQNKQLKKRRNQDILIGFVVGLGSSSIAGIILWYFTK